MIDQQAIDACQLCDGDGYLPTAYVCDHIDRRFIHQRGIALVRSVLSGLPRRLPFDQQPEAIAATVQRQREAGPARPIPDDEET